MPLTLHENVANECQAENQVVINALKTKIILEALDASLREGIPVDVVHDIHDDLY